MSVLINIENYEVYYLDYLEGNLNEEQTRAFLAFLEQHPELKMEDEALTILPEHTHEKLDTNTKNSFKIDLLTELITEESVEHFMIASIEKQLSKEQDLALQTFIQKHPVYQVDYVWYQKSVLPREQVSYPAKASLKRGGFIIPMYYKAIAIAASLILLLLFITNYNSTRLSNPAIQVAKVQKTEQKGSKSIQKNNTKIEQVQEVTQGTPIQVAQEDNKKIEQTNHSSYKTDFKLNKTLPTKALKSLISSNQDLALVPLNIISPTNYVSEIESDFVSSSNSSYLSVEQMTTPIYLLSKEIKKRFNQEIEIRSAKATRERQGGFYIKIGSFEIVRKRKPIDGVLAAN
jgi:hypothetical protein